MPARVLLLVVAFALAVTVPDAAAQTATLAPFTSSGSIGPVKKTGSIAAVAPGAYDVTGSGANIWGTSDEFHFASTPVGDADVQFTGAAAFLEGPPASAGTPDPHRKAGLMLRASLDADAPYVHAVVHGDSLIALQYRETKGGQTSEVQSPVRGPAVMRLERHGDVFSLEVQRPGGAFQPVAAIVVPLGKKVHAGLAVSAHNADRVERARFSGVRLEQQPAPAADARVTESTLEILDVASGERRIVHRARQHFEAPNWSRDGQQLLVNMGGLLYTLPALVPGVQPDASIAPTQVNSGSINGCNNDHGFSPDGTQIALSCGPRGESRVYVMPSGGGEPRLVTPESPSYWHGWSPDGQTLAYVGRRNGEYDIYTIPVGGGTETRITAARGLDDGPDYSPEGQWVYFNSDRTGRMRLYRMRPDGRDQQQISGEVERGFVAGTARGDWFPHPSPDGKWLVFLSYAEDVKGHPPNKDVVLRIMPADLSAPPRVVARLFGGQGTLNVPSWSPDSKAFAFVSYRLIAP